MTHDSDQNLRALTSLFWTAKIADTGLLVDRRGGRVVALNPSAQIAWDAAATVGTHEAVASALKREFSIDATTARRDAEKFIEGLLALSAERSGRFAAEEEAPQGGFAPNPEGKGIAIALGAANLVLHVAGTEIEAAVEGLFAPLSHARRASDAIPLCVVETEDGYALWADEAPIARRETADEMLGRLISEVTTRAYPAAQWGAVIHAAAIGTRKGALLIPGSSGQGKTTLTAGLVHAGFSYFGDDTISIDARTGLIVPMPLALSIKETSVPVLKDRFPELAHLPVKDYPAGPRRFLSVSATEGGHAKAPAEILAIIVPRYAPDGENRITPLSAFETLEHILNSDCWISPHEPAGHKAIDTLANSSSILCEYTNLDSALALIVNFLSEHG